ncbi:MAG: anti-sigma factor family protein [Actinomycetota bacterium]
MAEATDFEVHLATCPQCAGELARYREVVAAVASLRDEVEEPPFGFSERVVAHVLETEGRWTGRVRRLAQDRRVHVAAASVGGAIVGAGAIGLLWRRAARRGVVRTRVAV